MCCYFTNHGRYKMNNHCYEIKNVDKIVDGDTIYITVKNGFYSLHQVKIRLIDVDAPEIFRGDERERALGKEAHKIVKDLFKKLEENNKQLWIMTKKQGSFKRWLGTFFYYKEDGSTVNVNKLINKLIKHLE